MTLHRDFRRDWRATDGRPGIRVEMLKRWLRVLEQHGVDVQDQRHLLQHDRGGWRRERFHERWDKEDLVAAWIDQKISKLGRPPA